MIARIELWGRTIGALSLQPDQEVARFQYDPEFAQSGIQLAPIMMPLSERIYQFPELSRRSFLGLPGMLADALPDKFGHALIDAWLATQGRKPSDFNALERLCYVGTRGMGALEFRPLLGPRPQKATALDIDALVGLAGEVLSRRSSFIAQLSLGNEANALRDILRVGTSAGGARAKAVIAWNRTTNKVRSGQVQAEPGFEYWLLKFDGVMENADKELADPVGYGALEYAYHLMARAAGMVMAECRLLEENGRRHFMTQRFDRSVSGKKLHMQSLAALAHLDFNQAGAHSYEQAISVARQLQLPMASIEEIFRRMSFNVVARNQDDHVKNLAFLMNQGGEWALAPAFDVTYSYNPKGAWTSQHQMSIHGKREHFSLEDFIAFAKTALMKRGRAQQILQQVEEAVGRWPEFAERAQIKSEWIAPIAEQHRKILVK